MPAKNRMSISLKDEQLDALDRIATHLHRSRSEVIRLILEDFLSSDSDRFNAAKKAAWLLKKESADRTARPVRYETDRSISASAERTEVPNLPKRKSKDDPA